MSKPRVMTLDEFLEALAEIPCDWHINGLAAIRSLDERCPVVKLAEERGWESPFRGIKNGYWVEASKFLGLPARLRISIVQAADSDDGDDPALRQQLLKAVRLA